jgi:hypothetical protein
LVSPSASGYLDDDDIDVDDPELHKIKSIPDIPDLPDGYEKRRTMTAEDDAHVASMHAEAEKAYARAVREQEKRDADMARMLAVQYADEAGVGKVGHAASMAKGSKRTVSKVADDSDTDDDIFDDGPLDLEGSATRTGGERKTPGMTPGTASVSGGASPAKKETWFMKSGTRKLVSEGKVKAFDMIADIKKASRVGGGTKARIVWNFLASDGDIHTVGLKHSYASSASVTKKSKKTLIVDGADVFSGKTTDLELTHAIGKDEIKVAIVPDAITGQGFSYELFVSGRRHEDLESAFYST